MDEERHKPRQGDGVDDGEGRPTTPNLATEGGDGGDAGEVEEDEHHEAHGRSGGEDLALAEGGG